MRVVIALLIAGCVSAPSRISDRPLAITNATVIDGTGAPARPHTTVIIAGGRIRSIGGAVPHGAEVLDGTGNFLIPALWDMHVHTGGYEHARSAFPQMIASGILGIRDMGTPLEDALRLRREIDSGALAGPRMFTPGPLVQGPLPFQVPLMISVHNAAEADSTVRMLHERGVDFIKVHDALPRDLYFAVAKASTRYGIPFAGHVPPGVRAIEASNAGQRSIEHLGGRFYGVVIACSTREDVLMEAIGAVVASALDAMNHGRDPDDSAIFHTAITRDIVDGFSENKAAALIETFRRNDTWQTPTLVAQPLRAAIETGSDLSAEDVRYATALLELQGKLVVAMKRGGVKILAGTDSPLGPHALVRELQMLVAAGLTPMEALQSATRNAADFTGLLGETGTLERGKSADLVLLGANPLDDIGNVARVSAVVFRGKRVR